jgi:GT2 family glycosyltransferase
VSSAGSAALLTWAIRVVRDWQEDPKPVRFSIVIPSYCRADLLARCLSSVTRHAPPGAEILVVDDASVGGTIGHTAATFPGVRVLRLPQRRGFCAAVNAGLRAVSGDVIELLNDDTEVRAKWAEAALAWFVNPRVAAVAPLVLWGPDSQRIDSAGDRYFVGGIAGKHQHGAPACEAPAQACPVFGASASSAFYRREAVLRVGAFPENFGSYFEDVDVAFRLQRAGYTTMFEPQSRVVHRVSASYGRPRRRLLEQQSCNEERVFWRNVPARAWPRAVPWHLAVIAAKAVRRWHEGTLAPFLCGRLRVLTESGELMRHRRHLRALGPVVALDKWCVESCFWAESAKMKPDAPARVIFIRPR